MIPRDEVSLQAYYIHIINPTINNRNKQYVQTIHNYFLN